MEFSDGWMGDSSSSSSISSSNFTVTAEDADRLLQEHGIDPDFLRRLQRNRRVEDSTFYPLLITYALLIGLGSLSNGLIIWVVVRQRTRQHLHHLLMINLALSDLWLCLLTMPLTLMEIVTFSWPLGNYPFLCRLTGCVQAISVYVSTLTIAAIALDRYHLIVYPTREGLRTLGGIGLVCGIWLLSVCLAAPLFIYRSLIHHQVALTSLAIHSIDYCIEQWPSPVAGPVYSVTSILVQFLVPVGIMAFAHAGICRKLRNRLRTGPGSSVSRDGDVAKTHHLLSAITCTFGLCWMPLNIFNLVIDLLGPFHDQSSVETMLIAYAVCHLAGVSSACLNPLLYGWLNQNLRQELFTLFPCLSSRLGLRCHRQRASGVVAKPVDVDLAPLATATATAAVDTHHLHFCHAGEVVVCSNV